MPLNISKHFNKYFASVSTNINKKIPISNKHYKDYLSIIHMDKTFFLTACHSYEIYKIILTFDLKSL